MRFRSKPWRDVPDKLWNDWKWQFRNRVTDIETLKAFLPMDPEEEERIGRCIRIFPMAVTPHYLSLITENDIHGALRRQMVPSAKELERSPGEAEDPLGEEGASPVPAVIQRYPDRALILLTYQCAAYCRFCTRKRYVGRRRRSITEEELDAALGYVRSKPSVRDILLSGGDPFLLSDRRLESILKRVRKIPHVEVIRIGTRVPVVLPQRITRGLAGMLKRYHPLWINTHFNHPAEITEESRAACERLADAGIPLGNQTVLLASVNDSVEVMRTLVHQLVRIRVRPYYIFQCDLAFGLGHFRTPLVRGIEIIEGLMGRTSGFCIPTLAVDAPGGVGKVPLLPDYVVSSDAEQTTFRNYAGVVSVYPDSMHPRESGREDGGKGCSG